MSDTLQRYGDFAPTGFDSKGLNARTMGPEDDEDRSEWLVCPVSRTRDSDDDPLTASNWEAQLEALGGEGADVEIHRFGHWGPGWFEIVLVRPGTPAEAEAERLAGALEDYPLLNEDDHSRREYEADIEGIRDQAANLVRDDAPKDWPSRVYRASELESGTYSRPGGGSMDEDELRAVLKRLKLMEPKYLRVRVLALRQVTRPGFAPFYRDVTVKRYNPAYPL